MPADLTVGQYVYVVRKRIKLNQVCSTSLSPSLSSLSRILSLSLLLSQLHMCIVCYTG